MWATLNQPKITTQKTKNVSNTQPTKNHNTENKKGEQYLTNQKSQHRKPKRRATLNQPKITTQKTKKWATLNQPKITTQKTKKVSNTQPTKNHNTEN